MDAIENKAAARALRIAAEIIGRDTRVPLARRCGYEPAWFKRAQLDAERLRAFAGALDRNAVSV
jgi:hypothetical protein